MLSPFDIAAILILIAAVLGYFNHRWLGLPAAVGLTVMGAVASLVVVGIGAFFPAIGLTGSVKQFLTAIDFHHTLMDGMLSFLLFAGALHVDWRDLREARWMTLLLATAGTLLSTVLIGAGFAVIARVFALPLSPLWCMVFGALISPTDPVAVIAIMKRVGVSRELEAVIAAESLFNDGIGVVVFTILLAAASGTGAFAWGPAALAFLRAAGGGALLGAVIGYTASRAMRSIDETNVELMISLAVVMAGYSAANGLHVSGPVAMAVAGLLIGNTALAQTMSAQTKNYLLTFWALIDEILNAVLFLLIGLEVIVVVSKPRLLAIGLIAIPLVLLARALSVLGPLALMRQTTIALGRLTMPTLVWGGLRGGIAIALALSLPAGPFHAPILAATFVVVLFSVIVQGGTISALIARFQQK